MMRIITIAFMACIVILSGCAPAQTLLGSLQLESTVQTIEHSESPLNQQTSSLPQEEAPSGIKITPKLAQELTQRLKNLQAVGGKAPEELKEFLRENPDFLFVQLPRGYVDNQKGAMGTGEWAWLILPEGMKPEDDLYGRERLARFAENYRKGQSDQIVILSPGTQIPLWISLYTFDGKELSMISYDADGRFLSHTVHVKLVESDVEWMFIDREYIVAEHPKYGYEPIPVSVVLQMTEEAEVQRAIEKFSNQRYSRADTAHWQETRAIDGIECNVFYLFETHNEQIGEVGAFAIAQDLSRFYEMEQVNGQWVLQARPKQPDR